MIRERTRAEHLAWCKERALAILAEGDLFGAFTSMASDMTKHPDTNTEATQVVFRLGMLQMAGGHLSTPEKMRAFIEGFA